MTKQTNNDDKKTWVTICVMFDTFSLCCWCEDVWTLTFFSNMYSFFVHQESDATDLIKYTYVGLVRGETTEVYAHEGERPKIYFLRLRSMLLY